MFIIVTASRRLALLRSHPRTTCKLFHQTVIRTQEKASETTSSIQTPENITTEDSKSHINQRAGEDIEIAAAQLPVAEPDGTPTPPKTRRRKTLATDDGTPPPPKTRRRKPLATDDGTPPPPKTRRRKKSTTPDDALSPQESILQGNIRDPDNVYNTLTWNYGDGPHKVAVADRRRMNVISEGLCDDILERLKPSLEDYKGCDILDINPGAGLWSSKLHDYLKPRSHLLAEPDTTYYPLLQPLLDEPDSTYRLIPHNAIIWNQMEKILTKKYLPLQEEPPPGDPRLAQLNTSLLIVANLGYQPRKPYKGFNSLAQLVIYQFLNAMKANSLFHRYGLIRTLIWISDDEKGNVIPRNIVFRKKAAIEMDTVCPSVTEITSSTCKPDPRVRRDPLLDFESLRRVMKRMEEKGIKTPLGRESVLMNELAEDSVESTAIEQFKKRPKSQARLKVLAQDKDIQIVDGVPYSTDPKKLKTFKVKSSMMKSVTKKMSIMRVLVQNDQPIVELQKELYNKLQTKAADTIRDRLALLQESWNEMLATYMNRKDEVELNAWLDNTRAFNDQVLIWDRRPSEPLRARPEEFYPPKEMALFDLQPSSQWPVLRDNYPVNDELLEYIISQLNITGRQSVKKGLTSLWPGACEWLSEHCPSLTDPNRGGWPDLDQINVRRLSAEMYQEILHAWVQWPFAPTRWDIMQKLGSEYYDPDRPELDE